MNNSGADRYTKDFEGRTAAAWAGLKGHEEAQRVLFADPQRYYVHDIIREGDVRATIAYFKYLIFLC